MAVAFDRETIERFRSLPPRQALEQAKNAIYRAGQPGSEDFLDIYEQLVDESILTWEQIEEFEGQVRA